jgi:hypothetical protein
LTTLALDLEREDVVFFNLITPGTGITPGTISAYWFALRGSSTHLLFNKEVNVEASWGFLANLATGWQGPIDEASKYNGSNIKLRILVYKALYNFDSAFTISREEIEVGVQEKLKLQDTRALFSLVYRL